MTDMSVSLARPLPLTDRHAWSAGYGVGWLSGYEVGLADAHAEIERGLILAMWPDAPAGARWKEAVDRHHHIVDQRAARAAADRGDQHDQPG
jgi:hypothetical protein